MAPFADPIDLNQLDPEEQIQRNVRLGSRLATPQQDTGARGPLIPAPNLSAGVNLPPVGQPPITTRPPTVSPIDRDRRRLDELETGPQSGIEALHPKSTLGKIGKLGLRGLDVIGSIAAPGAMRLIPGTTMHHGLLEAQAERRLGQDVAQEQKEAQTTEETAQAQEARARAQSLDRNDALNRALLTKGYTLSQDAEGKPVLNEIPGFHKEKAEPLFDKAGDLIGFNTDHGLMDLNSPDLTPAMRAIAGAARTKPAPGPNQEQNKLAFQSVISKLDAAGLRTDPKNLDHSLDEGLRRGIISQQEHGEARGYQSANPTPGTNLTVRIAGQEATQAMKDKHSYYLYNGKMVTGDQVPANADAVPIKDPQQFKAGATVANTVAKSFNHLADDNVKIFDDPKARAVLATPLSDEGARQVGLLVAGTGGSISLPGGAGKIIDQLLENHAVPANIQREVKNYIVDYWGMRDKLLAMQMEMQGGKIGRGNAVFFNAMLAQLPGAGTSDAVMARRQMNLLQETMSGLKEQFGDLADVEPKKLEGDTGEPQRKGSVKLSPAGAAYLDSILGKGH